MKTTKITVTETTGGQYRLECSGDAVGAYRALAPGDLDDLAIVDTDGCVGTRAQCERVAARVREEMA